MAKAKAQHTPAVKLYIKNNGKVLILLRNPIGHYYEAEFDADTDIGFESPNEEDQAKALEWCAKRIAMEAEYQRSLK
ncbi:hypothetical protein [Aeromonas hydrophila]|uniref:hypothetical protein n=1 Tax=Aeromonas hydrophila TaxID=644 RepID=UPI003D1B3231